MVRIRVCVFDVNGSTLSAEHTSQVSGGFVTQLS